MYDEDSWGLGDGLRPITDNAFALALGCGCVCIVLTALGLIAWGLVVLL
jgi:hypothetical protein